ncbi:hypothetical protein QYE76_028727 [Lolium multiflorum]|uniref:AP2/ERF domain-containing protein n=1 Tax=Lolium multiflorum TaxID=4521 RepID=A0AAD8QPS7_LOLMU|nr:hypothetical protein QYE76_028727 [Lolium multiflorum]
MAPRRRSNTGFIGVLQRATGHFASEITTGGVRVWLGTFYMKEAAARAYDVAAWRSGRRIDTTEADEQFMAQWRRDHPGDVEAERAFWKSKQTYRRERRAGKRQRKAAVEAEHGPALGENPGSVCANSWYG